MRRGNIERKTAETDVALQLAIDGSGRYDIETGCGFLNHMLELFARHGRFDLMLRCKGDTQVDMHHTAEDIAICLGAAFDEALGDRRGIRRYEAACFRWTKR
jgi:imidazoleglycerol-phosphate dehydratase